MLSVIFSLHIYLWRCIWHLFNLVGNGLININYLQSSLKSEKHQPQNLILRHISNLNIIYNPLSPPSMGKIGPLALVGKQLKRRIILNSKPELRTTKAVLTLFCFFSSCSSDFWDDTNAWFLDNISGKKRGDLLHRQLMVFQITSYNSKLNSGVDPQMPTKIHQMSFLLICLLMYNWQKTKTTAKKFSVVTSGTPQDVFNLTVFWKFLKF